MPTLSTPEPGATGGAGATDGDESGPIEQGPVGDDWVALVPGPLTTGAVESWVVLPSCGAVVTFRGTSRDHSGAAGTGAERRGVTTLEYEAYGEQVEPRFAAVVAEARRRWPTIGRLAIWHRTGVVPVGEASVLVAVSTPHRDEAFAVARFAIDAVKVTVPIWKREVWPGGSDWGVDVHPVEDLTTFDRGPAAARPPADPPRPDGGAFRAGGPA